MKTQDIFMTVALICGSSLSAFLGTGNVWIGASVALGLFAVIWPHRPKASG